MLILQGGLNFENRTIWLNGLSIEIKGESSNTTIGGDDITIEIKWDERDIENDVRWCGNIALSPNDFDINQYSLNVLSGNSLLLDRGLSPTQHLRNDHDFLDPINGDQLFTQPTLFTCLPNSKFHTDVGSKVSVENGSTLKLEANSLLEVHGVVFVKSGSTLHMEAGSELLIHNNARVVIFDDGNFDYDGGTIRLNGPNAVLEIAGTLDIADNTDFTYVGGNLGNGFEC